MKRLIAILFAMMLVLSISNNLLAQDTLDVAQGYETLNLAVEGDTLPDGTPANPNRVFRLERNGYYLLNGAVRNTGDNTIRIVAADGEGALPILIPAADETGASTKAFQPRASGVYKNL